MAHGSPATLYTVAVDRLLRWPSDQPEPSTIHVLRYDAAVRVDWHVLCSEPPRSRARPGPGRDVLMLTDEVVRVQPILFNALVETLFFETPDGAASVPGEKGLDPVAWDRFRAELLGTPPG